MTDIRELLDGIEKRADAHHLAAGGVEVEGDPYFSMTNWRWTGKPHRLVYDLSSDNKRLVAALRAVLDDADKADAAASQVMEYGVPSGKVSTINLRRAITEALGGGA